MTRGLSLLAFSVCLLAAEDNTPTFRSESRLVVAHVSVSDSHGDPVNGLPQSAFQLTEDGVPQQLASFRQEDAPVSLQLVIDNSASMADKRASVEAALLKLVQASNPSDETAVINFAEQAYIDQGFTGDLKTLAHGLKRPKENGETALFDAAYLGVAHLRERASQDKKVMLCLTDGADNRSISSLARITREAQEAGIQVYAIALLSVDDPAERTRGKKALDAITVATGGEAYYPESVGEVEQIAQKIARDIRNQYTVAYRSTNSNLDGKFRSIKVTVNAPGVVSVRQKAGYYALP